jgi:hypothetical protein
VQGGKTSSGWIEHQVPLYYVGFSASCTYSYGGYRETASVKSDPLAEPQTTTCAYHAFMRPERVTAPGVRKVVQGEILRSHP